MDSQVNRISKSIREKAIRKKQEKIGKIVSDNYKKVWGGYMANPNSPALNSVGYRVEGDKIVVYSTWEGAKWFEEGTKPHIIRPKDKKSLRFRSTKGNKGFGNFVFAKEVKHPGTPPKPIGAIALFQSLPRIKKLFSQK